METSVITTPASLALDAAAAYELDATQLLMPILGFLPASGERMRSTIEAIAGELTEDGLEQRYRNEEGLITAAWEIDRAREGRA